MVTKFWSRLISEGKKVFQNLISENSGTSSYRALLQINLEWTVYCNLLYQISSCVIFVLYLISGNGCGAWTQKLRKCILGSDPDVIFNLINHRWVWTQQLISWNLIWINTKAIAKVHSGFRFSIYQYFEHSKNGFEHILRQCTLVKHVAFFSQFAIF